MLTRSHSQKRESHPPTNARRGGFHATHFPAFGSYRDRAAKRPEPPPSMTLPVDLVSDFKFVTSGPLACTTSEKFAMHGG
jgi:hypothetical protein